MTSFYGCRRLVLDESAPLQPAKNRMESNYDDQGLVIKPTPSHHFWHILNVLRLSPTPWRKGRLTAAARLQCDTL